MTYLSHGAEYLDDQEMRVYRSIFQLNKDGRTTNNSQIAVDTGMSRVTVGTLTARLLRRGFIKDVGKGNAYNWRIGDKVPG